MFITFLSILSLMLSWSAAYLLSIPALYFVRTSKLANRPILRAFHPPSGQNRSKGLQKLIFAALLAGWIFALSELTHTNPALEQLRQRIQDFLNFKLTQTLMDGLLANLALALGIFLTYQAILFVQQLFPRVQALLRQWRYTRFRVIKLKSIELFTPDQITDFLLSLTRYLQVGLTLILLVTGFTYALSFFSSTQRIAIGIFEQLEAVLNGLLESVLEFLPNLFALLVILIATRFTLRLLHFLYEGVQENRIRIFGLHQDLAEPTYQLLRFLVFAFALVAAYPYFPGSDSPVFRGITIFAGFLLSMGSTALVTNIVSGVVLTYTRGLQIGDRVKIGGTTGDVVERTLLVTRIVTIKNVVVSIPNSMVLNNEIINYSKPTSGKPLILHTSVTIGYDVPWRTVSSLLIQAAMGTEKIEKEPRPFVLQTSLDDYYVSYELNAYTSDPKCMVSTYSELHQNIQDQFNSAGVEIMSPAYMAYRDGSPEQVGAPAAPMMKLSRDGQKPAGA